jgi:alkanesulfonate monooxygenase SsuD/methylene tetrahydromethanopterin reductase-like flavin-dependent oxidoreductase (luciferase family)
VLDGNPKKFQQLAIAAEKAGWQGFYIWDHVYPKVGSKIADPWISLAVIATSTERIRLGTTVTPLPRRRPQKITREVVTLDQLSNGRFTLGVGLGHPPESEFKLFGEDGSLKTNAEKLDESLEILEGLWKCKPFSYNGIYYKIGEFCFKPRPIQKPRVPIWCAGWWPIKKPFRRAAQYDGIFPFQAF